VEEGGGGWRRLGLVALEGGGGGGGGGGADVSVEIEVLDSRPNTSHDGVLGGLIGGGGGGCWKQSRTSSPLGRYLLRMYQ